MEHEPGQAAQEPFGDATQECHRIRGAGEDGKS